MLLCAIVRLVSLIKYAWSMKTGAHGDEEASGILGGLLGFVDTNRTDEMPDNDMLELTVESRPPTKQDPWI